MERKRRAFFFDFDGTLWFGTFGDRTLSALQSLHAQGDLLFYNSGRSQGNTSYALLSPIPFDGFLFGGCHIVFRGKELFRKDCSKEAMALAVSVAKRYRVKAVWEGVNGSFRASDMPDEFDMKMTPCDDLDAYLDTENMPITKFDFMKEKTENGYLDFPVEMIETMKGMFEVNDFPYYTEFLQKNSGKDVLIEKIRELLSIEREDCYCFGDSYNDLPMFRACAVKVAIGHAPDAVKAQADYVTQEEENGVAEALAYYGLI